ncbi:MAG: hypothetical protein LQ338_000565 [Usnochroma carphineum]|nr:MAG: hypothetical protein LQ338_000565 [Usnochroma carphineum]
MDMFAKKIRRDIEDLDSGFKWFCKSIELGPLAGQQSAEVIKARMLYLISTQTAITRFRDKVVPEGDIDRTIGLLGDSYTSTMPSLPFKCRFGLLSLHCRFGMLREATKIIQFVQEAPHSRYMNLLIRTLRQSTITEARERIEDARVLVAQCQSKTLRRLEAEALIIKVCFVKVVEVLDAVSAHQQENVHKWLQQADELVSMYPNSAGLLKTSLESVKKYWRGEKTTAELWTPETRNFWEKWGRYEVGSLIYCKHGHPYPKTVLLFRDCPECGRFFDPTAPALQPDYETQLNREKFLEHLRRMMGTH